MKTNERTILVTGASRGIGRAISHRLLQEGYSVIGIGRSFPESSTEQSRFTPVTLDLAHLQQLPEQLGTLCKDFPAINGIVCCAGYGRFGALEEFSPAQIKELIDLNLTSQILMAREFLPKLKRQGGGDLIFIGSEAALSGGKRGAVYSATKFALRGLAQSLREECAGSGVRVGIINPGMVESAFFDNLDFRPGKEDDQHLLPDDVSAAAWLMLGARPGAAIDEINLSPHKKVIRFMK